MQNSTKFERKKPNKLACIVLGSLTTTSSYSFDIFLMNNLKEDQVVILKI
jgi:fluoride ion exporter CrcB/FEX